MTRKRFLLAVCGAPLAAVVKMRPSEPFCAHMPRSVAVENEVAFAEYQRTFAGFMERSGVYQPRVGVTVNIRRPRYVAG